MAISTYRIVVHQVAKVVAADFKRRMKPFNSSGAIVEEKDVVANVKLIIAKCHSASRVPTLDFLHEFDEFIPMLANFSRKVLGNVNVAAFQKSSFAQDLFFVAIVDQTHLNRFVTSEVGAVVESVDSVHHDFPGNVKFL